jgi:hypothetical protein
MYTLLTCVRRSAPGLGVYNVQRTFDCRCDCRAQSIDVEQGMRQLSYTTQNYSHFSQSLRCQYQISAFGQKDSNINDTTMF